MIPVVEKSLVDEADEVSSVIVVRLFVGVDVLDVVEDQHAEQRNLMWDHDEQQGLLPVPKEDHGVVKYQHKIL